MQVKLMMRSEALDFRQRLLWLDNKEERLQNLRAAFEEPPEDEKPEKTSDSRFKTCAPSWP